MLVAFLAAVYFTRTHAGEYSDTEVAEAA